MLVTVDVGVKGLNKTETSPNETFVRNKGEKI